MSALATPGILNVIVAIPFLAGLACWLGERVAGPRFSRGFALAAMLATFGLTLSLWLALDPAQVIPVPGAAHPPWLLEFQVAWIPRFGISWHLAVDGLSLLLLNLTALLGVLAIACSWREIQEHVGFFYLNLLWNLGGVLAVFLALDLFLFFFFWEMMLVPMFFLIALWGHNIPGGRSRIYAALKFFIFTQASGLLMLVSILALVFVRYQTVGTLSFDYEDLLGTEMAPDTGFLIMLGFFVAFMVKLPVPPFHTWLPDAHGQAPTAGSAVLAGVLLKTAAFGYLRFALPLFPEASASFAPVAIWLGVIGVVYGAFQTFAQQDIKRLIAYSSISHMGFVLIGIYVGNQWALQGAIVTMLAHGLSAAALFILCGALYERIHTRELSKMGGLWTTMPWWPPAMMFFALAALGLPGLGNFVGEFLVLIGTFATDPLAAVVAASGMVLSAAYALRLIQRTIHGPATDEAPKAGLDLREAATMATLMLLLIALGVYPQPVLDTASATVAVVAQGYQAALAGVSLP